MAASTATGLGKDVCVVGTGVLGLLAIKNLKEQGLQPTALERNDFIAGNWHVSQRDQTSVVEQTTLNTSTQTSCFTDFPYPKDTPTFAPAKQVEQYLQAYAKHFDLYPCIEFNKEVVSIDRDSSTGKWTVIARDVKSGAQETRSFSRVVVATGVLNVPNMPKVKGIEKFEGEAMHSRLFKDPSRYAGKTVVVVGVGATGADTLSFLKKANAKKVYASHRGQYFLLPRWLNGKAFDHQMNRRATTILRAVSTFAPRACAALMSNMMVSARKQAFPWLSQHPSFMAPRPGDSVLHRVPVFSDDLAEHLRDGGVEAVTGIQEISGPHSVTLTDGKVLDDVDAIIFCSGYEYDFSMMKGAGNPVDPAKAPDGYKRITSTKFYNPHSPFPRLWRGIMSEEYPESLAFLGHALVMGPPFVMYDLFTMALAGTWAGGYPIDPPAARARDIDVQYDFVCATMQRGPVPHPGFRMISGPTFEWMNQAAGTGVTDRVACWSLAAWKLWWSDRRFYNLLMGGIDVPAVYRLFDTGRGRKPWSGARAQIELANETVNAMGEKWKKEQAQKQA